MEDKDYVRLRQCCVNVIEGANKSSGFTLQYAATYAKACLQLPQDNDHQLHVQILYILANLNSWRGKVAKHTKQELRYYKDLLK